MECKIEGVNIHKQIVADDPRLNYTFIKEDEIKDEERGTRLPEFLDKELIDYDVVIKKELDDDNYTVGLGKLDTIIPSSYCAVKTVEEGIDWFQNKHPEYPSELCEILARYTWGEKIKPQVDNTSKGRRRRKKKGDPKFKVKKGDFQVVFD